MAKADRRKATVAKGTKRSFLQWVKDRLNGGKLDEEERNVLSDLLESEEPSMNGGVPDLNPFGETLTQNPIERMTRAAILSGKYDEFLANFQQIAHNLESYVRENADDQELINKYQMAINNVKAVKEVADVVSIENGIIKVIEERNNCVNNISNYYSELLTCIANNDFAGIEEKTGHIVSLNGNYGLDALDESLNEFYKKYEEKTGKKINLSNRFNLIDINVALQYYREIHTKIAEIEALSETEKKKLEGPLKALRESSKLLPNIVKDKSSFIRKTPGIMMEIAEKVKNRAPQPERTSFGTDNAEEIFRNNALEIMKRYIDKSISLMENFVFDYNNRELQNIKKEIDDLFLTDSTVSETFKNRVNTEIKKLYSSELDKKIGKDLVLFIEAYNIEFIKLLSDITNSPVDSTEFIQNYNEFINLLERMYQEGQGIGITVSLDNEQNLSITFPSAIKNITFPLLDAEKIEKLKSEGKLRTVGVSPSRTRQTAEPSRTPSEAGFQTKAEQQRALEQALAKVYDEYWDSLEENILNYDSFHLPFSVNDIMTDNTHYNLLSDKEKWSINDKLKQAFAEKFDKKYDIGFVHFIMELKFTIRNMKLDTLKTLNYESSNFKFLHENALKVIEELKGNMQSNSEFIQYLESIEFDEDTQILSIVYKDHNIKPFSTQIVSDQALQKLKESKVIRGLNNQHPPFSRRPFTPGPSAQPGAEPRVSFVPPVNNNPSPSPRPASSGTPSGTPRGVASSGDGLSDEARDVQLYVDALMEENTLVQEINNLNVRLEAQVIEGLTATAVADVIANERTAKEYDRRLVEIRLQLSKDRLEFKKKYNKFIINYPEVKSVPKEEIEFRVDYATFIEQRDEQINAAFAKIKELYANGFAPDSPEILDLLSFVDAQQSLISRRLVCESKKDKNFDVVTVLKERREKNKKLKESLKNPEPAPVMNGGFGPSRNPFSPAGAFGGNPSFDSSNPLTAEELQVLNTLKFKLFSYTANLLTKSDEDMTVYSFFPLPQDFLDMRLNVSDKLEKHFDAMVMEWSSKYEQLANEERLMAIMEIAVRIRQSLYLDEKSVENPDFTTNIDESLQHISQEYASYIDGLKLSVDLEANRVIIKGNVSKAQADIKNCDFNIVPNYIEKVLSNVLPSKTHEAYMVKVNEHKQSLTNYDIALRVGEEFSDRCQGKENVQVALISLEAIRAKLKITQNQFSNAIKFLLENKLITSSLAGYNTTLTKEELLQKIEGIKQQQTTGVPNHSETHNKDEQHPSEVKPEVHVVQRKLALRQNSPLKANKGVDFITDGDVLTISLITNGVKISYSNELREKLKSLSAKIGIISSKGKQIVQPVPVGDETEIEIVSDQPLDIQDQGIRIYDQNKELDFFDYKLKNIDSEIKSRSK